MHAVQVCTAFRQLYIDQQCGHWNLDWSCVVIGRMLNGSHDVGFVWQVVHVDMAICMAQDMVPIQQL